MTITSNRRLRSPKAFVRKDARNAIYKAMYGEGDRRNNYPAAYDPNRKHNNPDKVDWKTVRVQLKRDWNDACFDELTANKIISDFNHYNKKGEMSLTQKELLS